MINCTIIDNYISSEIIIYLEGKENNYLSYYNLINNNSPCDCIIYVWDGKYQLNNKNSLFYTNGNKGKLEIYNCKINHLDQLIQEFLETLMRSLLNLLSNEFDTILSSSFSLHTFLPADFSRLLVYVSLPFIKWY